MLMMAMSRLIFSFLIAVQATYFLYKKKKENVSILKFTAHQFLVLLIIKGFVIILKVELDSFKRQIMQNWPIRS